MEGGISISEDPNLRFTYVSNGAKRFRAEADRREEAGHPLAHGTIVVHDEHDWGLGVHVFGANGIVK